MLVVCIYFIYNVLTFAVSHNMPCFSLPVDILSQYLTRHICACNLLQDAYFYSTTKHNSLFLWCPIRHGNRGKHKHAMVSSRKISGNLNCSLEDLVACARISCDLASWPRDTSVATISLGLSIDMTILSGLTLRNHDSVNCNWLLISFEKFNSWCINFSFVFFLAQFSCYLIAVIFITAQKLHTGWHMSPATGIGLQSTARAAILTRNPQLIYNGNKLVSIQYLCGVVSLWM